MKTKLIIILLIILNIFSINIFASDKGINEQFKVIGYYSGDLFDEPMENLQTDKLTHVVYAFLIPKDDGGLVELQKPEQLIYWMTLPTPLTVVERYRHSFDVFPDSNRTQPFGSGATCVYLYRDLMIKNDTDEDFQLCVNVGNIDLEGCWRSDFPPQYKYEIIEKNHMFKSEYWGGFSRHNELYRRRYDIDGVFIDEEYVTENHALMMYAPFLSTKTENSGDGH